jgi:hypothetical protein
MRPRECPTTIGENHNEQHRTTNINSIPSRHRRSKTVQEMEIERMATRSLPG